MKEEFVILCDELEELDEQDAEDVYRFMRKCIEEYVSPQQQF